jgi:hypothetical protein
MIEGSWKQSKQLRPVGAELPSGLIPLHRKTFGMGSNALFNDGYRYNYF